MLGSLYGDLPDAKDKTAAADVASAGKVNGGSMGVSDGWGASSLRLTPAKRSTSAIPPSVLRAGRGRGRGGGRGATASGVPTVAANPAAATADAVAASAAAATFLTAGGQPLVEEYDPGRPNDYAKIREARDTARKEAEKEAERQEMKRAAERAAERVMAAAQAPMSTSPPRGEPGYAPHGPGDGSAGGGASAAMTGEEAHARRAMLGRGGSDAAAADEDTRGMSLAAKMMEKMGWRGGGLGREQQGMATPLIAQKKDNRSGVIVQGELDARPKGTKIQGKPTKVVLLRNMVAPGQVDATLEDEVGEECTSKYGTVAGVVIFEVTAPKFPAELAVRIFVAFERQESAIKAAVDLGGRFFGGRLVQATFYDEDRFKNQDYAPGANEE